jgi:N-acetylglucosaminyl-diphospho-decaprenol L-rhamnosyltransferase
MSDAAGLPPAANAAGLIINFNGGDALLRCVAALRLSDFGARPLLVVDNASRDGSPLKLRNRFPEVELIVEPENVGFAAGVNAGLERLLARDFATILLLNPDTEVAPDFFAPLAQAVAAGAAIAGPKLVSPPSANTERSAKSPRRIWSAGGAVTFGRNLASLAGHREADRGQWDAPRDVTFLPGTAWLVTRALVETIGTLDDGFFCYVEDVDYCLRATESGARLRYEPRSLVVHEGSAASGGGYTKLRKYLNSVGAIRLLRKHGTAARWLRFIGADVLTWPFALVYASLRGRPAAAIWKGRGLLDGWRSRPFDAERRAQLLPEDSTAKAGPVAKADAAAKVDS